jgi:signal peptidase II
MIAIRDETDDPSQMTRLEQLPDVDRTAPAKAWLLAIPPTIVLLDQIIKAAIVSWIGPEANQHRIDIFGNWLAFDYVENRGAAFGIFPQQTGWLTAISIIITIFGFVVMWRELRAHPLTATAIGMVVGGAIGNIVDRIRVGYVVDFVAVGIWPRFNLADAMITVGIVLLLFSSTRDERNAQRERANKEVPADG